jgi:predicted Zn-dependent peptidase
METQVKKMQDSLNASGPETGSEYQKTVLDNGLRVVTEKIPYLRSVSIGVWVITGSRDEQPQ